MIVPSGRAPAAADGFCCVWHPDPRDRPSVGVSAAAQARLRAARPPPAAAAAGEPGPAGSPWRRGAVLGAGLGTLCVGGILTALLASPAAARGAPPLPQAGSADGDGDASAGAGDATTSPIWVVLCGLAASAGAALGAAAAVRWLLRGRPPRPPPDAV